MCAAVAITIKDYRRDLPGKIDPKNDTVYEFDQLVSTGRHRVPMYWRILVRLVSVTPDNKEEKFIPILDEYFDGKPLPSNIWGWIKVVSKVGEHGKVRATSPTYVREGKNIGKANQTNVFTQALRDALSKHNKQAQKSTGAVGEIDGVKLEPPMLAKWLLDVKESVNYDEPVFIQRKYDGVRVVAARGDSGDIVMYSRSRHLYPGFSHLRPELAKIFDYLQRECKYRIYLDGEMYKHGVSLQILSGVARRAKESKVGQMKEEKVLLEYHIFDCFAPSHIDIPFADRWNIISNVIEELGKSLQFVKFIDTWRVDSKEEVDARYNEALREGFEGVILRLNRKYEFSYHGYHSGNLLKIKPEFDGEFKIVSYTAATHGKAEGELMLICVTETGEQFTVNLGGMTTEDRKQAYRRMSVIEENGKTYFENHLLGKMLTVIYEDKSIRGVPVRATTDGIVLRDYE